MHFQNYKGSSSFDFKDSREAQSSITGEYKFLKQFQILRSDQLLQSGRDVGLTLVWPKLDCNWLTFWDKAFKLQLAKMELWAFMQFNQAKLFLTA